LSFCLSVFLFFFQHSQKLYLSCLLLLSPSAETT
jgi:hypothetical protein